MEKVIKVKAKKALAMLGLICLLEALVIGFFLTYSWQAKQTIQQQEGESVILMQKTGELLKQVTLLERQALSIEREYSLYITGIARDLSPMKVKESLLKTRKYYGIGGGK